MLSRTRTHALSHVHLLLQRAGRAFELSSCHCKKDAACVGSRERAREEGEGKLLLLGNSCKMIVRPGATLFSEMLSTSLPPHSSFLSLGDNNARVEYREESGAGAAGGGAVQRVSQCVSKGSKDRF